MDAERNSVCFLCFSVNLASMIADQCRGEFVEKRMKRLIQEK